MRTFDMCRVFGWLCTIQDIFPTPFQKADLQFSFLDRGGLLLQLPSACPLLLSQWSLRLVRYSPGIVGLGTQSRSSMTCPPCTGSAGICSYRFVQIYSFP